MKRGYFYTKTLTAYNVILHLNYYDIRGGAAIASNRIIQA